MARSQLFDKSCTVYPEQREAVYVEETLQRCGYTTGFAESVYLAGDDHCYYLKGKSDGMMHSGYMTWNELCYMVGGMNRAIWYFGSEWHD